MDNNNLMVSEDVVGKKSDVILLERINRQLARIIELLTKPAGEAPTDETK